MKRFLAISAFFFLSLGAFAQSALLTDVASGLQGFTDSLAPVMPLNSTIGTAWSDAYIGPLLDLPPHFGVGITSGVTYVPSDALTALLGDLNVDSAAIPGLDQLIKLGIPMPAAAVNARIGGFILPFDIGLKVGPIPEGLVSSVLPALDFSYLLVGADVRYALLNEKKNFIDLSVGLGLNYLNGSIGIDLPSSLAYSYGFTVPDGLPNSGTHTLAMSAPKLFMSWQTVSVDLSAQVSKRLLGLLTPYAGVGLTIGKPTAQTGLKSTLSLDGTAITQDQAQGLMDLLVAAGLPAPVDASTLTEGYIFKSTIEKGTDLRAYGGLSFDVMMIRTDFNVLYSFIGKNFGVSIGVRVQF